MIDPGEHMLDAERGVTFCRAKEGTGAGLELTQFHENPFAAAHEKLPGLSASAPVRGEEHAVSPPWQNDRVFGGERLRFIAKKNQPRRSGWVLLRRFPVAARGQHRQPERLRGFRRSQ